MSNLTFFDLTLKVARHLGGAIRMTEGTATGGSTTTIVDNPYRAEADDYWNYGNAWITYDAGGAGAAPQGEFARISDHVSSTWTTTIGTLTAAVASGDRYAVCRRFGGTADWIQVMKQHINNALSEVGPIPLADTTTITTASDQTEYSIAVAANQDLRQVWLQTNSNDANANQWVRWYDYELKPNTAGTADLLIFRLQPPSTYSVMLYYMAAHGYLNVATDQLNEHIPENLVVYPAVRDCFMALKNDTGWDNWDQQIQVWTEKAEREKQGWQQVKRPGKTPRLMIPQDNRWDSPTFTGTVNLS